MCQQKLTWLLLSLMMAGCAPTAYTFTNVTMPPTVDLRSYRDIYIVRQDKLGVERLLRDGLAHRGFNARMGSNLPRSGMIVKYEYNYHWDMFPYLQMFAVNVIDARSGVAVARAEARRNSFARQEEIEIIEETIDKLFPQGDE